MSFFSREYTVFLVLGAPDAPALWQASVWSTWARRLDALVQSPRGKAAVRSIQYPGTPGKPLSFGRLGWDEGSERKWTHAPDHTTGHRFLSVEAWSPSWTTCERDDLAPDFFLQVINEQSLGRPDRTLRFNQRVVCAVAGEVTSERALALADAMQALAVTLQAPVLARAHRPWGRSALGGFTGAIQDMALTGLFQPGDVHARPLDEASLVGRWDWVPV